MDFDLPKDLKISLKSTGSIISISTIIGIIFSLFSYFRFDKLDIQYRIIICLSIFLIISIIDIVILYVRDRELQYKFSTLKFANNSLKTELEILKMQFNETTKKITDNQSNMKG